MNDKRETYKNALITAGSVKIAPSADERFTLRSGKLSWMYVDFGDLLCQPETNLPYVEALQDFLQAHFPPQTTILANVDSKSSPQTTGALAAIGKYRQIIVIPKATQQAEKGTNRGIRLPKDIETARDIVLIDDVLASGLTAMNVAQELRETLTQQFTFHLIVGLGKADVATKAKELEEKYNVKIHWLLELKDIIQSVWNKLTNEQKAGIKHEFPEAFS